LGDTVFGEQSRDLICPAVQLSPRDLTLGTRRVHMDDRDPIAVPRSKQRKLPTKRHRAGHARTLPEEFGQTADRRQKVSSTL
jgi:hypothetical protein